MKDDLASLLAHETDDAVPEDHERRIREGLGALLTAAPPTPSGPTDAAAAPVAPTASPATVGATVKLTTAALVGLGLAAGGFALGRATAPPAPAPAPASAIAPASAPAPETAPASGSASGSAPAPAPAPAPEQASPSAPAPASPAPSAASAFDREQSLLERARSALVRHDARAAAEALDAHDKQFPASRHAEERDYLRIQLLRERGDTSAARERARAFLATYPESLLRARVEPLTREP